MANSLVNIALCVVTFFIAPQLSAQNGQICGAVQNETGAAAAFINVVAFYMGAHSGPEDTTKTDDEGNYCIEHVRPGEYFMSAQDAPMGYPLMLETFYMPRYLAGSEVTVSDSSPHRRVSWRIPYRAGFLHITATDRSTGKVIPGISFRLAVRGSEELRFMRGTYESGNVLLPPNEAILVIVEADGYKPWPSDEPKGRLLSLPPGVSLDLPVLMEPAAKP